MRPINTILATLITASTVAFAGTPAKQLAQPATEVEFGRVTLGGKYSEDLTSGYVDAISALAHTGDFALFVNVRGTFADNDQQQFSVGLGARYLIEDAGVILGANVYYDYIDSTFNNEFHQLGLGAEVLSKWVDARFNYYIPEGDQALVGRISRTANDRKVSDRFENGLLIQRLVRDRKVASFFDIFEEAREGWNTEVGVLIPGLDPVELRIFAGAYSYDDPRQGDLSGFRARAEARVTEGITLDVEYWEHEELVGGNWVAGVRVDMPFEIGRLFEGRNPFAGANILAPRSASTLRDRMDEMVIRSHRIQTTTGAPVPAGSTTTITERVITEDQKTPAPAPTAPAGGGGDGGNEEPPPQG